jgi:hypothetical protein
MWRNLCSFIYNNTTIWCKKWILFVPTLERRQGTFLPWVSNTSAIQLTGQRFWATGISSKYIARQQSVSVIVLFLIKECRCCTVTKAIPEIIKKCNGAKYQKPLRTYWTPGYQFSAEEHMFPWCCVASCSVDNGCSFPLNNAAGAWS